MLKLNNIGVPKGANRDKKRRGRGPGSGGGHRNVSIRMTREASR